MLIIGLTGSMATGKSTLVRQIRMNLRWPIWDADSEVQKLYKMPDVIERIGESFPEAKEEVLPSSSIGSSNDLPVKFQINRNRLRNLLSANPSGLTILENILHPILANQRHVFLMSMEAFGQRVVVLDIPLLFEKGLQEECDYTVVTNCPLWLQKQRILSRKGMTSNLMNQLLAKQIPLAKKRLLADIIVETGLNKRHSWTIFDRAIKEKINGDVI